MKIFTQYINIGSLSEAEGKPMLYYWVYPLCISPKKLYNTDDILSMRHPIYPWKIIATLAAAAFFGSLILIFPKNSSAAADDIDPSQIEIVNAPADALSWPSTATITRLELSGQVIVDFDKREGPDSWPEQLGGAGIDPSAGIQYTLWLFVHVDNRWVGSAFVQFWKGRELEAGGDFKNIACNYYGPNFAPRYDPMTHHWIKGGEQIAFMVTAGSQRNGVPSDPITVSERSNIRAINAPFDTNNPDTCGSGQPAPGGPGTGGNGTVTVPSPNSDGVDALAGQDPSVAFDPAKRQWLVVAEKGGKIQGQLMTDANKKNGTVINIGGTGAHTPKVAYGPSIGKYLVVWTQGAKTAGTLQGRLLNADGSPSGTEFQISSGGATLYSNSNLQYDARGQRFVLAYEKSGNRVDVMAVGISGTGAITGPTVLAQGVSTIDSGPSIAVNPTTGAYCASYLNGNKLKIQPFSDAAVGTASDIGEAKRNIGIIYIGGESPYLAAWLFDGTIKSKILAACADDPNTSANTLASQVQTGVLTQNSKGFGLFVVDASGTSDRFISFDSSGTQNNNQSIFAGTWDPAGFWPAAGANSVSGLFAAAASPDRKNVKFTAQLGTPNPTSAGGPAARPTVLPVPEKGLPTDLGQLINAIYNWALAIIGLVIFVRFLWAGIKWFTAAGNPGPISEAKTIMKNAAYGAAVLFSAYLILNTINPDFVGGNFNLPGLSATQPAPNPSANTTSCLTGGGSSYSDAVQNMETQVLDNQPSLNAPNSVGSANAFIQALITELRNYGYTAGLVTACNGTGNIPYSIMVGFRASDKTGEVCTIFDDVSDGSDSAKDIKSTMDAACNQHAPWTQLAP